MKLNLTNLTMLTYFLKSISYFLHPLLMTWIAAVYFFSVTPVQYPPTKVVYWLLSIVIWSLLFPLLLYVVLKKLNAVRSIHLKTVKERFWPLLLNSIIMSYLGFFVLPKAECVELHYFILGSILTIVLGLTLSIIKIKASIHMMAVSGAFLFMILTNLHFGVSIDNVVIVFVLVMGAMASSRLHLNAHSVKELAIGLIIGVLPQILLFNQWL
tara:strand:+ start:129 stop:764 length:636 start_codon:yes stop_codon:yes gene_type:complete